MFGTFNLWAFLLAVLVLNMTPGQDTIYILSRSISQGKRAGYWSVLGIIGGCSVHILAAAFGLSAILAGSSELFTVIKWLGACYLIYLGLRSVYSSRRSSLSLKEGTEGDWRKILKQGFFTNLFNPKVALFFLAFFPQFIDPTQNYGSWSFLYLGLIFLMSTAIWCLGISFAASGLSEKFRQNSGLEKRLNQLSGICLIGLGINLIRSK